MQKYFIGIDESYNSSLKEYFVLSCLVIKSEDDNNNLGNYTEKILQENRLKELKHHSINDRLKTKVLNKLKRMNNDVFYFIREIDSLKDIKRYYKQGLEYLIVNYLSRYKGISLDIKIDTLGGEKFRRECIKIISKNLKENNIKHNIKYKSSKSAPIIQFADLLAGDKRVKLKK